MPNRPVIKVIQNRDFLSTTPEKSVRAVAYHMKQYHLGAAVVVDPADGTLLGICTERDLSFKVLAEGLDPNTTPVGEVMTRDPLVVSPDRPFGHVLHMMFEGGFRHMPVVDPRGRPIGVVSARDALALEIVHFRDELQLREALTEIL
ncbi:MAG: cyclic nucleotide-binding/CBS domain-containing protein [Betaproteobacteria bacterium]|jgi:CBS domain-containing protein